MIQFSTLLCSWGHTTYTCWLRWVALPPFPLLFLATSWVLALYTRVKCSLLIYSCLQGPSNSKRLLRQWFQSYDVMSFLINKTALLSFQIWLKLIHRVRLPENTSSRKTAEAHCPNHRLMKTWPKMTTLDSKVLMNTTNCGRCMICFEHIYYDWCPKFGKLIHSQ